jgi:coiled-coil domain-containing protein 130
MRHHCGCRITITTDPKSAEYEVTAGARRKVESYDPDDAQVCGCGWVGLVDWVGGWHALCRRLYPLQRRSRKTHTINTHPQTVELPDANERAAVAADPLATLERTTLAAEHAAAGRASLTALAADREVKGRDGYSLNKQLRAAMRSSKKADAKLDAE